MKNIFDEVAPYNRKNCYDDYFLPKKEMRACPGVEHGTSSTQSENHATRPTGQRYKALLNNCFNLLLLDSTGVMTAVLRCLVVNSPAPPIDCVFRITSMKQFWLTTKTRHSIWRLHWGCVRESYHADVCTTTATNTDNNNNNNNNNSNNNNNNSNNNNNKKFKKT